jgi:hypothetical protein
MNLTPVEELEDLREQIEKATESSVHLELSILAKTKEILSEKGKLTELKQKRRAGVSFVPGSVHFDTEGISTEYIDFVRQKENTLTVLSMRLWEQGEMMLQLGLQ